MSQDLPDGLLIGEFISRLQIKKTLSFAFSFKWINKHIHNFGGDKNQVTLSGFSAGGCSASMLALIASDPTNMEFHNLFKNVLLQSGSIEVCLEEGFFKRKASEITADLLCGPTQYTIGELVFEFTLRVFVYLPHIILVFVV